MRGNNYGCGVLITRFDIRHVYARVHVAHVRADTRVVGTVLRTRRKICLPSRGIKLSAIFFLLKNDVEIRRIDAFSRYRDFDERKRHRDYFFIVRNRFVDSALLIERTWISIVNRIMSRNARSDGKHGRLIANLVNTRGVIHN